MDAMVAPLQSELLDIKHSTTDTVAYPNHAFAKGGVGQFLATGARAGMTRLPQTLKAQRQLERMLATHASPSSTGSVPEDSVSMVSGLSAVNVPMVEAAASSINKEWERGGVKHPHNFCAASRSARRWDVPAASRWAGMSFYENDPARVTQHLHKEAYREAVHVQGKLLEREIERARHTEWAALQREVFARQRLEQASRYACAGIRPRSAYVSLGATAAASELQAALAAGAATHPHSVSLASTGGFSSWGGSSLLVTPPSSPPHLRHPSTGRATALRTSPLAAASAPPHTRSSLPARSVSVGGAPPRRIGAASPTPSSPTDPQYLREATEVWNGGSGVPPGPHLATAVARSVSPFTPQGLVRGAHAGARSTPRSDSPSIGGSPLPPFPTPLQATFQAPALQRPLTAGPGSTWRAASARSRASSSSSVSSAPSHRSAMMAGISSVAELMATAPVIALPKPTQVQVYARMAAEDADMPVNRAAAIAAARSADARAREEAVVSEQLAALDEFEASLAAKERQRQGQRDR